MFATNIISAYQGVIALNSIGEASGKIVKEAESLRKLCNEFKKNNADLKIFNGYYIGYTIKQISKEFDLLRFSDDMVINIELKSHLDESVKYDKITKQMKQNYYYLKFLGKRICLYTYIEDDGLYMYSPEEQKSNKVGFDGFISIIREQKFRVNIDLDKMFVPSNYLISPFNHTEKFIKQAMKAFNKSFEK